MQHDSASNESLILMVVSGNLDSTTMRSRYNDDDIIYETSCKTSHTSQCSKD